MKVTCLSRDHNDFRRLFAIEVFSFDVSPWYYVIGRARPVIVQCFKTYEGHYYCVDKIKLTLRI